MFPAKTRRVGQSLSRPGPVHALPAYASSVSHTGAWQVLPERVSHSNVARCGDRQVGFRSFANFSFPLFPLHIFLFDFVSPVFPKTEKAR